jgi:hypothetical protein
MTEHVYQRYLIGKAEAHRSGWRDHGGLLGRASEASAGAGEVINWGAYATFAILPARAFGP